MNILTDRLPQTVTVGASQFEINTDFRAGIEFELLVEEGEENKYNLVRPFFPDGCPTDINGALEAILWFYCCGETPTKKQDKPTKEKQWRLL